MPFLGTLMPNVSMTEKRYHKRYYSKECLFSKCNSDMALTKTFKESVAKRLAEDPAFAHALLDEAIHLFIDGESGTAKAILRDLVNATIGFETLAFEIDKPPKSLHRMLSEVGNPTMTNISTIFAAIKSALKVEIRTEVVPV